MALRGSARRLRPFLSILLPDMDPINHPGPTMRDGYCFPCTNKKWDWMGAVTPEISVQISVRNSVFEHAQHVDILAAGDKQSDIVNHVIQLQADGSRSLMNQTLTRHGLRFAVSKVVKRGKKRALED